MTKVEQRDRDAAAQWAKRNSRNQQAANIKRGSCDTAPLVQAFVAHRLATEAQIVAWLRTNATLMQYHWAEPMINTIANGEHRSQAETS